MKNIAHRVIVCETKQLLEKLMPLLTASRPDVEFVPLAFELYGSDTLNDEQHNAVKDCELLLTSTKNLPSLSQAMPKLKWAHSTWAGVDSLFVPEPVKSVFINVGRGNIIKDIEVMQAVDKGWLSGAILDVFETEPLPDDSPLWSHPKIVVTPHVSALSVDEETTRIYIENLRRYEDIKPLNYIVDWNQQY